MQGKCELSLEDLNRKRVYDLILNLDVLNLTEDEWQKLSFKIKKNGISRLSKVYVLLTLSEIRSVDYDELLSTLERRHHPRIAKALFADSTPKLKRFKNDKDKSNPLIFSATEEAQDLHSPLKKQGVRIAELVPASPERGYIDVHETPGKTKVRPVFANNVGCFFQPLSPYKSGGLLNIADVTQAEIERKLPRLEFAQLKPIHFIATLDKLREHQQKARRVGQNALMHARCRDVFAAHVPEGWIISEDEKFHWEHLIGHFYGGKQSKENLIPGTAASNYNTLKVVEYHIAKKLLDKAIKEIEIVVTPLYSGESMIPNQLLFKLNWIEKDKACFEEIVIDPRSHRPITSAMLDSIDFLRKENSSSLHS